MKSTMKLILFFTIIILSFALLSPVFAQEESQSPRTNLNDFDLLMSLISLLRERRAEGDLSKALTYSTQLVEEFENLFTRDKPARVSAAQWEDRKSRGLASVYMIRGQVLADLNNTEKA